MQQTFRIRRFTADDLELVTHINRVCLPENYSDYFFIDLHKRFPETFIVAEGHAGILGYIMCRMETGLSNFGFHGLIKKGHIEVIHVPFSQNLS